jgi:hypothetical protein
MRDLYSLNDVGMRGPGTSAESSLDDTAGGLLVELFFFDLYQAHVDEVRPVYRLFIFLFFYFFGRLVRYGCPRCDKA